MTTEPSQQTDRLQTIRQQWYALGKLPTASDGRWLIDVVIAADELAASLQNEQSVHFAGRGEEDRFQARKRLSEALSAYLRIREDA